jgi:hypothetical protein
MYNAAMWLETAANRLQNEADRVRSGDNSGFQGDAAKAFVRVMDNMRDEMRMLRQDLNINKDWVAMLHDNAAAARAFWQGLQNTWTQFLTGNDPTEMLVRVLNQMEQQVDALNRTQGSSEHYWTGEVTDPWPFTLDFGAGPHPYNLADQGALGQLNGDMHTYFVGQLQALDQSMRNQLNLLRTSHENTRANIHDVRDYIPPAVLPSKDDKNDDKKPPPGGDDKDDINLPNKKGGDGDGGGGGGNINLDGGGGNGDGDGGTGGGGGGNINLDGDGGGGNGDGGTGGGGGGNINLDGGGGGGGGNDDLNFDPSGGGGGGGNIDLGTGGGGGGLDLGPFGREDGVFDPSGGGGGSNLNFDTGGGGSSGGSEFGGPSGGDGNSFLGQPPSGGGSSSGFDGSFGSSDGGDPTGGSSFLGVPPIGGGSFGGSGPSSGSKPSTDTDDGTVGGTGLPDLPSEIDPGATDTGGTGGAFPDLGLPGTSGGTQVFAGGSPAGDNRPDGGSLFAGGPSGDPGGGGGSGFDSSGSPSTSADGGSGGLDFGGGGSGFDSSGTPIPSLGNGSGSVDLAGGGSGLDPSGDPSGGWTGGSSGGGFGGGDTRTAQSPSGFRMGPAPGVPGSDGSTFGGLGSGSTVPGSAGGPSGDGTTQNQGGMPFMPPMGGGMGGGGGGGNDKERERKTWLAEDEDVWGTDPDLAPAVIGRDDTEEYVEDDRSVRRPVPPTTTPGGPARSGGQTGGRGY